MRNTGPSSSEFKFNSESEIRQACEKYAVQYLYQKALNRLMLHLLTDWPSVSVRLHERLLRGWNDDLNLKYQSYATNNCYLIWLLMTLENVTCWATLASHLFLCVFTSVQQFQTASSASSSAPEGTSRSTSYTLASCQTPRTCSCERKSCN